MKTIVLSSVFLFWFTKTNAQQPIGVQSLPEAGFTYLVTNDSVTSYTITAASSSAQTWNFANLLNNYQKVPTYDSTSKTPYTTAFPTSNIYTYGPAAMYGGLYGSAPVGTQGMNNGYMFWRTNSTGFWVEGFRADNGSYANKNIHYTPNELLIPLPGTLNASYSNASRWVLPMNSNPADVDTYYVSNTKKTFLYDSYGAITTPTGAFPEVLRLHEYTVKIDSAYARMGSTPVYSMELRRDTTNTYFYISKDYSYPILTTFADKNNNIKFTEYYTLKYPASLSAKTLTVNNDLKTYPNPFNDYLYIQSTRQPLTLSIYTIAGNMVKQVNLSGIENSISVSDLNDGIYISTIKTIDGKEVYRQKIIKQRE